MTKAAISVQNLTKVFPVGNRLRTLVKRGAKQAGKGVLKGISLEVREV